MLSASNNGEMFKFFKTKTALSFYLLRPLDRSILRDAFVVLLLEPHINARNTVCTMNTAWDVLTGPPAKGTSEEERVIQGGHELKACLV